MADRVQGAVALAMVAAALAAATCAAAQAEDRAISLLIQFDAATREKLADIGEWVTVASYYSGDPAPGARATLTEEGQVYLGEEQFTIRPVDQTVRLGGILSGMAVDQVGLPYVNINLFTARTADENNLINCDILDMPIDEATRSPQAIRCTLIDP
jgi:hypothetical protein